MRKVLVLSYFFPPCNLPAAQRPWGWARHFMESGLYPVIVTRNWDHPVRGPEDVVRPGGTATVHETNEQYEAFYLPHPGSLRDRVYVGTRGNRLQWLSKPLTLTERVGHHFLRAFTPLTYLYDFAREYLRAQPEVRCLVVTGGPFVLFKFASQLAAEFAPLQWVADYRDEWTTSALDRSSGVLATALRALDRRSERRWLGSASFVTSVSPYHTRTIAESVGRPGHTVYNGFELEGVEEVAQDADVFTIVYSGTLYPTQPVEELVAAVVRLSERRPHLRVRLSFPGIAFYPGQLERVKAAAPSRPDLLELTERLPRPEVIRKQLRAHALVMLAHPGAKGIASSKIFEYMGLGRPVVVYPNDHDVLEDLISDTQAGFVCDRPADLDACLDRLAGQFMAGGRTTVAPRADRVALYSRAHQTRRFADLLAQP
jgi:glycosyltransferase involved in cell wall biosynthesis